MPNKTLRRIQSLVYNFIWESKRELAWKDMAWPKLEGVVGLRGFATLQLSTIIERVKRAWTHEGVWADWVRRYIKSQSINEIRRKNGDSKTWKTIIDNKNLIMDCMDLLQNQELNWKRKGNLVSLCNIWSTIYERRPKDHYSKGLRVCAIPKTTLLL